MKRWVYIITIFCIVLSFEGCYSLRKKFVRKKKLERKEEEPVYLDLKSYPVKPPLSVYNDYYVFIDGWLDELEDALKRKVSWKREKRAVDQVLMNFEQMLYFFEDDKKKEFDHIYNKIVRLRENIYKTPEKKEGEINRLVRDIEDLRRILDRDMNPTIMEKWMISK